VLRNVDVSVLTHFSRHLDDLVRECQLIEVGAAQGLDTSASVANLAEGVLAVTRVREGVLPQVVDAAARGEDRVDIELQVTERAAERVAKLRQLFQDAAELQRRGLLLLDPLDEDIEAQAQWAMQEIVDQVEHGAEPTEYSGTGR
jgi:hypothetical protein